jgi:cation:H+ antiporter
LAFDFGPYQDVAYFIGGLAALIAGGQLLIRGAIGLGQVLNLSPVFTGLVIVSIGSSLPELIVSLTALHDNQPDLAIGNVVGSNITNILLILGLAAIISPIAIRKSMIFRDAFMMLLATAIFVWVAQNPDRQLTSFHGTILVGLLVIFVLLSFVIEQLSDSPTGDRLRVLASSHRLPIVAIVPLDLVVVGVGIVLLYFGAHFMVGGASGFAERLHVSQAVIGLSVIAVGTSLPELATTLIAALQRKTDIVVGNILGSNIFNILAVVGISALRQPIDISARIASTDMWIMLASAVVLVPFMMSNWRLSRGEGVILVIFYFAYIGALYSGFAAR